MSLILHKKTGPEEEPANWTRIGEYQDNVALTGALLKALEQEPDGWFVIDAPEVTISVYDGNQMEHYTKVYGAPAFSDGRTGPLTANLG